MQPSQRHADEMRELGGTRLCCKRGVRAAVQPCTTGRVCGRTWSRSWNLKIKTQEVMPCVHEEADVATRNRMACTRAKTLFIPRLTTRPHTADSVDTQQANSTARSIPVANYIQLRSRPDRIFFTAMDTVSQPWTRTGNYSHRKRKTWDTETITRENAPTASLHEVSSPTMCIPVLSAHSIVLCPVSLAFTFWMVQCHWHCQW